MAKNNQKKEKALRNKEYARKFRKKKPFGRRFGGGSRPSGGGGQQQSSGGDEITRRRCGCPPLPCVNIPGRHRGPRQAKTDSR
jgi:hypothetical protein